MASAAWASGLGTAATLEAINADETPDSPDCRGCCAVQYLVMRQTCLLQMQAFAVQLVNRMPAAGTCAQCMSWKYTLNAGAAACLQRDFSSCFVGACTALQTHLPQTFRPPLEGLEPQTAYLKPVKVLCIWQDGVPLSQQ